MLFKGKLLQPLQVGAHVLELILEERHVQQPEVGPGHRLFPGDGFRALI